MNFSNSKDERLLMFYESVRRQSISISKPAVDTGLPVTALNNMPKSYARKWNGGCGSCRLIGRAER